MSPIVSLLMDCPGCVDESLLFVWLVDCCYLPETNAEHVMMSDGDGVRAVSAGQVPCLAMVVRV